MLSQSLFGGSLVNFSVAESSIAGGTAVDASVIVSTAVKLAVLVLVNKVVLGISVVVGKTFGGVFTGFRLLSGVLTVGVVGSDDSVFVVGGRTVEEKTSTLLTKTIFLNATFGSSQKLSLHVESTCCGCPNSAAFSWLVTC